MLRLDGFIRADGEPGRAAGSCGGGGGSGGSVLIEAESFSGQGMITARGGSAPLPPEGGGGGGRIAVHVGNNGFSGTLDASGGGTGLRRGGAGTVFVLERGSPGTLVIDNGGLPGALTDWPQMPLACHVVIRRGGRLGPAIAQTLALDVDGDVTVEADGSIDATGRGYGSGLGPGAGVSTSPTGGCGHTGGAYGGAGAPGAFFIYTYPGGAPYGSVLMPTDLGSGGGGGPGFNRGGFGGGALRLDVSGSLRVDGVIRSNGEDGRAGSGNCGGAGGSGGSVLIDAASITGSGTIEAAGGLAPRAGEGGGGGGRMAIRYGSLAATVAIDASGGGAGIRRGGAGTVYLEQTGQRGVVIVDNGGSVGMLTGILESALPCDLVIRGGGRVGPASGQPMDLTLTGDVLIETDGAIDGTGQGFEADLGPGAGVNRSMNSGCGHSGGGHGGQGGGGFLFPDLAEGGGTYGSVLLPVTLGSGGGGQSVTRGGNGGGAIRLTVVGDIQLHGAIRSNGEDGLDNGTCGGAGGAGGSILITADSLSGAGLIEANGGLAPGAEEGGGGGGRIALYLDNDAFTGTQCAMGGGTSGPKRGGAGTMYKEVSGPPGRLTIDNGGLPGALTDLHGAVLTADLTIHGAARVGPIAQHLMHLSVIGGITVDADGAIDATGRGYPANMGPGAGQATAPVGGCGHSGGGYGGRGGDGHTLAQVVPGGGMYGSPSLVLEGGSGGGGYRPNAGGAGGGVIRLDVTGELRVEGAVRANGADSPRAPTGGCSGGGGSGGGILISTVLLTGSGVIEARGGDAFGVLEGGGGGGRVALYVRDCNPTFAVTLGAEGGLGGHQNGAPGSVLRSSCLATVGPQGGFPTLQAALNGLTGPDAVVLVEPGAHPAFTLGSVPVDSVRILAAIPGTVVIDTTTGPVQVLGTASALAIHLEGLSIGDPSSANPAVVVDGCQGLVVLDRVSLAGGLGQPGVRVQGSPGGVLLQTCEITGAPGLSVDAGSFVGVAGGALDSVDVGGGSVVVVGGGTPSTTSVAPGSSLTLVPGVLPVLEAPQLFRAAEGIAFTFHGPPQTPWVWALAPRARLLLPQPAGFQMPLVVDPSEVLLHGVRITDALGEDTVVIPWPALIAQGYSLVAQSASVDAVSGVFRLSNVVRLTGSL